MPHAAAETADRPIKQAMLRAAKLPAGCKRLPAKAEA